MRSRFSALATTLAICALSSFSLGNLGCSGASKSAASPAQYPAATGGAPSEPQSESVRVVATADEARPEPMADKPAPPSFPAPAKARDADAPAPAAPPHPSPPRAASPTAPAEKADPTKQAVQNRDLVIYTARFTMAIYQVEQGLAAVERIARDNGGYLGMKKDSEITVRIPRGRFEITLAAIDKVGDVLHRDIQAQDVTDEHVDLEIRIKNARAMQQRLSDLLTKASVKDALEIEKELHRVTEELERLEGRMKVLKDKIAFSTVTVQFQPRGAALPSARVHLPFPWLGGLNLPSLLSLSEEK